jgi:hypothetical protein
VLVFTDKHCILSRPSPIPTRGLAAPLTPTPHPPTVLTVLDSFAPTAPPHAETDGSAAASTACRMPPDAAHAAAAGTHFTCITGSKVPPPSILLLTPPLLWSTPAPRPPRPTRALTAHLALHPLDAEGEAPASREERLLEAGGGCHALGELAEAREEMQCRGRLGLDAPLTHQEIKSYALVWHALWSDIGGINGLEHSIGRALPPFPPSLPPYLPYFYVCVLVLLYICRHTSIYVSSQC